MKKTLLLFAFMAIGLGATSLHASENDKPTKGPFDFKTSVVSILKNAKTYTIEVAEAMPAEDYTFKTADSVKTFGEQMAHIAMSSMFIHKKLILGEELPQSEMTEASIGASKEQTIKMLNMSFDAMISSLEGMSHEELHEKFSVFFLPEKPEFTKIEGFLFIRDHVTHHRGQAIVYLRVKGHKAPDYRAF
ncbi:MAG: hypothetical protein BM563_11310 [Bacteroidetes bacterium MedPE-SWsnd-G1]|nr:MAG: hypothetical protein BM563_11310 [Bacteroidetes bacterium MedPE-SWsnd-G1]